MVWQNLSWFILRVWYKAHLFTLDISPEKMMVAYIYAIVWNYEIVLALIDSC